MAMRHSSEPNHIYQANCHELYYGLSISSSKVRAKSRLDYFYSSFLIKNTLCNFKPRLPVLQRLLDRFNMKENSAQRNEVKTSACVLKKVADMALLFWIDA